MPPEHRIAVRLSAETRDDVAVPACLRRRVLEHFSELRWRSGCQLFGKRDCALEMRELLGMPERQEEEGLLPRCFERRVVADVYAFEGQSERFRVLRIRLRRVPVEGARELVEFRSALALALERVS